MTHLFKLLRRVFQGVKRLSLLDDGVPVNDLSKEGDGDNTADEKGFRDVILATTKIVLAYSLVLR